MSREKRDVIEVLILWLLYLVLQDGGEIGEES